jgi:phage terminase small subunit
MTKAKTAGRGKGLNPKQSRFVQEYMVDMNATAAYIRSGYSPKTAESAGPRMLSFVEVAKAIKEAQDATAAKIEVTRNEWLAELKIIGFSDLADYIEVDDDTGSVRAKAFDEASMPKDATRALESITEIRTIREDARGEQSIISARTTFRLHSKLDALKTIGEHCGFLKNKVEHTGPDGGPMVMIMSRPGK